MKIIRSVNGLRRWRRAQVSEQSVIGFVPTMGAFHLGHESLMQRARRSCHIVIVSIFVNPLQFGQNEDLDEYPRPRQTDLACCRNQNVDVVFMPRRKDLYPPDFQTSVEVSRLAKRWEGANRKTHFQGVTTVVTKLLNLVSAHRAYLGQKDYQQCCVIKQMVRDLNQDTRIVMCPTVRETDGLALSSRNKYLNASARKTAPILYQALCVASQVMRKGEKSITKIEAVMRGFVRKDPKVKIDYLTVCDSESLDPCKEVHGKVVLLGAVRLGKTRLLDNLLVKVPT
ncbi:MAG: pantoate--beta-alanine ligase [Nitrospirales bacterium]